MEKYPVNKETLEMIDSSFFVVSLENEALDKDVRCLLLEMCLWCSSDAHRPINRISPFKQEQLFMGMSSTGV